MTPRFVWMRPTTHAAACRYKLPRKLTGAGRKLPSECGVWVTPYLKERVLEKPSKDLCPHCFNNTKVAEPHLRQRKKQHREDSRFNFTDWD